jgi:hypothetical protein
MTYSPAQMQALAGFERVLLMIERHRERIERLDLLVQSLISEGEKIVSAAADQGRSLSEDEVKTLCTLVRTLSTSMVRLISLERRASGLKETDTPSELEQLSASELAQLRLELRRYLRAGG